MIETLQTILFFIVAIGILVTVHEFGHFWVARKAGVQVLRFSVGFGKPLFARKDKQGTEYVVAAIPLGGYVRMLGEHDDEVNDDNRHLSFSHKPILAKTAIVIAGPLANFIFAIAAYWLMFVVGIPGQIAVIGEVQPDSMAWKAGMKPDEQIIRINQTDTPTWSIVNTTLLDAVLDSNNVQIDTRSLQGNYHNRYQVPVVDLPRLLDEKGIIHNLGIRTWQPPVWVGEITPDSPADRAGLIKGDKVVSVDGQEIGHWGKWVDYIRQRPGVRIDVQISRSGEAKTLQVIPKQVIAEDGQVIGQIGVMRHVPEEVRKQHLAEVRYGPVDALGQAVFKTYELSELMVKMLGRMVVGDASHKNISGPITIAQYASVSASLGWLEFVRFLALISVSLGVLNLLPIPMLDGGHLLYYVIESVRGGPLSEQAQVIGQQVGITLLLLLMGLAFYNDISRLLG